MTALRNVFAAAIVSASIGAAAQAVPTYPNVGNVNATVYSFTATNTGNVIAYFAGQTAGYDSVLGLLVNGVDSGITGLPNHGSSIGDSLNFGPVTAGDTLEFYINVAQTGLTFFSTPGSNPDAPLNHVYAANFGGDANLPAGTYVGFEDLLNGGDLDYDDLQFVFTNVSAGVPEAATWAMMLVGFGAVGGALRRTRTAVRFA